MRIFKIIFKVFKWILLATLFFLLACNLYIIIRRVAFGDKMPRVFGFSVAVVLSPSMEPEISVNDVVLVHTRREYTVGDVVMYRDSFGDYTTHRIVAESESGFILKGDNNDSHDGAIVPKADIVGAVFLTLPNAGVVSSLVSSPLGALATAAVGMAILFLPDVVSELVERKGKKDKE